MNKVIAVFGSASGKASKDALAKAEQIGKNIAKRGYILLTGACPLIPYAAAKSAKKEGGLVVGISPAENFKEHIEKYKLPTDVFDVIIYTGFGYKGRNVINVRSADAVVAISGRIGTLNELTTAYDEGKPIGILDIEGVSREFPDIVKKSGKKGAQVIMEKSPDALIDKLVELIES